MQSNMSKTEIETIKIHPSYEGIILFDFITKDLYDKPINNIKTSINSCSCNE